VTIILTPPGLDGLYGVGVSTLREIEQEVARRVGPFLLQTVTSMQQGEPSGPVSTPTTIPVGAMRSSLDLGGMEDRFVLRRGRLASGDRLPLKDETRALPFDVGDRVRLVRRYSPVEGVLEVDRAYANPCHDGEEIELHHLDPQHELRPAVLAGLRRCWLVHRLELNTTVTGPMGRFDLTAFAPWITARDQVYDVTFEGGAPMVNWRADGYQGGVTLQIGEWSPGKVFVFNRRPVASMVRPNPWPVSSEDEVLVSPIMTAPIIVGGEEADGWEFRTGNANEFWGDEDEFACQMDYAAGAGHIECWRSVRPRMALAAQTGLWAEQEEAAAEFTRVATVYFDKPRHQTALPMWPSWWWNSDRSNAGL
jgi:hypothetical protein